MTTQLNGFFPLLRDKETGRLSIRIILGIPILSYLTWQATSQFIKINEAVFFDSKTILQFFLDGHFLVFIVVFGIIKKATELFATVLQGLFFQSLSLRIQRKIKKWQMTPEQYNERCKKIAEHPNDTLTLKEIKLIPSILRKELNSKGWKDFTEAMEKAKMRFTSTVLFFTRLFISLTIYLWGNTQFSGKTITFLLGITLIAIFAEGIAYVFVDTLPMLFIAFLKTINGGGGEKNSNKSAV